MINYTTPGILGTLGLKNRVFIPAHATGLFDSNGQHTDHATQYYSARISGGAALVFLGETLVTPQGETWSIPVSKASNDPFYKYLANLGNNASCIIFDQLSIQGGQVWWKPGVTASAPSSVPQPISGVRPDEMTASDISKMRRTFIEAAQRTIVSGLHGCELKADQGKLIYQFLSRRYNRRTDIYGGHLINRLRFLTDILKEIRSISSSFCLGIRIPIESGYAQSDIYPDLTFEEIVEAVSFLKQEALIDYLNVSSATNAWPHGYWMGHADFSVDTRTPDSLVGRLRSLSGLPILYAGQFIDLSEASLLLQKGVCDYVGLARAHIADPEFTKKNLDSRTDDIRPCIRCNQGCVGNTWEGRGVTCIVNPITGRESHYGKIVTRSRQKKRVMVIGSGPAGLEFSTQAALCGWDIMLADSLPEIGGRLLIARKHIHNTDWRRFILYYRKQLDKLANIELRLGFTINQDNLDNKHYDHIVFAGGRKQRIPEEYKIFGGPAVYVIDDAWDRIDSFSGKNVLVLDEDPYQGTLILAAKVASIGAHVTIITGQEYVGKGLDQVSLTSTTAALRTSNITIRPFYEIAAVQERNIVIRCLCSGQLQSISCDVLLLGIPPMQLNFSPALPSFNDLHIIGDARFPRGVEFALLDAHDLLKKLTK